MKPKVAAEIMPLSMIGRGQQSDHIAPRRTNLSCRSTERLSIDEQITTATTT